MDGMRGSAGTIFALPERRLLEIGVVDDQGELTDVTDGEAMLGSGDGGDPGSGDGGENGESGGGLQESLASGAAGDPGGGEKNEYQREVKCFGEISAAKSEAEECEAVPAAAMKKNAEE